MRDVFDELKRLDGVLAASDYVAGDRVTEADVRLLPTVERFDACYAPLFLRTATSIRHDFPHVFEWSRRMRALPGVAETVDARAAARSYYTSLFPLNPSGIVPVPPDGYSTTVAGRKRRHLPSASPPASPASHHLANNLEFSD